MMTWRLLNTGARNGAWNMAVDEVLWRGVQEGKTPPTLRFFAWTPATLSVGYGQSIERDIDVNALERLGIPLVRRPTGGRAVVHDRELTYSVVFPADLTGPAGAEASRGSSPGSIAQGHSILRDYAFISRGLVLGLRDLGVAAELAPVVHRPDPEERTGACFSSASAYEVMVQGKKIVGSAQRRGAGAVLQHGSVPLDLDVGRLSSLFKTRSPEARGRLAGNLAAKMTCVKEALSGRETSYEEACAAFEAGFREVVGELVPGALTPEEEEAAVALAKEKRSLSAHTPAGRRHSSLPCSW
ncbi:MAG: biotin/lipoate A/B protein ligase family protein [Nitrospinota bacterium]